MKGKLLLNKWCLVGLFVMVTLFYIIGCKSEEQPVESTESEPVSSKAQIDERPVMQAREITEAMLGVKLPEDAVIEDYIHKWGLGTNQGFQLKVTVDKMELEDLEDQIIIDFGKPMVDNEKGISCEDDSYKVYFDPVFISSVISSLNINEEKIDRIYFRYGTGGIKGESQPFTTQSVYAFVMREDAGQRVVYFSYGA